MLKDAAHAARLAAAVTPSDRLRLILEELRGHGFHERDARVMDKPNGPHIALQFHVIGVGPAMWTKCFVLPWRDATASGFAAALMTWRSNMLDELRAGRVGGTDGLSQVVQAHGLFPVIDALMAIGGTAH